MFVVVRVLLTTAVLLQQGRKKDERVFIRARAAKDELLWRLVGWCDCGEFTVVGIFTERHCMTTYRTSTALL